MDCYTEDLMDSYVEHLVYSGSWRLMAVAFSVNRVGLNLAPMAGMAVSHTEYDNQAWPLYGLAGSTLGLIGDIALLSTAPEGELEGPYAAMVWTGLAIDLGQFAYSVYRLGQLGRKPPPIVRVMEHVHFTPLPEGGQVAYHFRF